MALLSSSLAPSGLSRHSKQTVSAISCLCSLPILSLRILSPGHLEVHGKGCIPTTGPSNVRADGYHVIVGEDPHAVHSRFPPRPVHERAAEIEDHRAYHENGLAWTRTSENAVKRKSNFGERPFHALR